MSILLLFQSLAPLLLAEDYGVSVVNCLIAQLIVIDGYYDSCDNVQVIASVVEDVSKEVHVAAGRRVERFQAQDDAVRAARTEDWWVESRAVVEGL